MKVLILSLIFVVFSINSASCGQRNDALSYPAGDKNFSEAYLAVDSVDVSSFDVTPDWAPPQEPKALVDGSFLTRWASDYQDDQWIILDFGKSKVISKIIVYWEAAYAVDYDILISKDKENWKNLLSLKDSDGGIDKLEFSPAEARYVKIIGRKRVNPTWGISVWEVLCFGPENKNPEDKPLIFVYPKLVDKLELKDTQEAVSQAEEPQAEKPLASPGALLLGELQKGVVYTSWGKTELGTEASDQTLEYLKESGVRYVSIMIIWSQASINEKIVSPDDKDTPDDMALVHAINKAHSLGMKVMLKPHIEVKSGEWRGEIIPSEEWFASYSNYIIRYAAMAEQYHVEVFSIGTELANTTYSEWQSYWESIIKEVRKNYSGRLVYGANWNEYKTVGFWDKLDFIGMSAYFPLTTKKDPTKEELVAGWKENCENIGQWLDSKGLDKPVIFTEIGYCSADGANTKPWSFSDISEESVDQEEQANSLEAMFIVCFQYPWFKGFYLWSYFPQERWSPLGYTIRGKLAEDVFKKRLKSIGR